MEEQLHGLVRYVPLLHLEPLDTFISSKAFSHAVCCVGDSAANVDIGNRRRIMPALLLAYHHMSVRFVAFPVVAYGAVSQAAFVTIQGDIYIYTYRMLNDVSTEAVVQLTCSFLHRPGALRQTARYRTTSKGLCCMHQAR